MIEQIENDFTKNKSLVENGLSNINEFSDESMNSENSSEIDSLNDQTKIDNVSDVIINSSKAKDRNQDQDAFIGDKPTMQESIVEEKNPEVIDVQKDDVNGK